ncbi:WXG100 family type VII secretion target [Streptomyces sp. NBC_01803]|uniref:WXG100 family type VII secretion target n=1 Tax=Streptomyces sp. NBC_01803 TaxID=2975946 RepID=UPI002DD89C98|nr:WXG100 family type VII secretion target [Streptomyces sp. NBC_01803]WSA44542.1 WXG100 family type VII secretion target [Streptomyces sp. NBC_01803]
MDADPTPGRPEEVRELADELQEFADDVGEALGKIRGMASDRAVLDWAGLTADAFRTEFDGVSENLTKFQTSYDMAAEALARYWPTLENAQALADRALEQAIAAQTDLRAAQAQLIDGEDWVSRAGDEAERLQDQARRESTPEPPSESDVRSAVRDHQAAQAAVTAAQDRVSAAEEALSAAQELARQAQEMREDAARECARDIDAASDAGIHNRRWWEQAIDWVRDNWDTIVEVCKLVVAVLGVVVMIIGGPLAWVVLAAALIVLADTLVKYARGQATLLDVAFAAVNASSYSDSAAGQRGCGRVVDRRARGHAGGRRDFGRELPGGERAGGRTLASGSGSLGLPGVVPDGPPALRGSPPGGCLKSRRPPAPARPFRSCLLCREESVRGRSVVLLHRHLGS